MSLHSGRTGKDESPGDLGRQPGCHRQRDLFGGGEVYSSAWQPQQWVCTSSSESTGDCTALDLAIETRAMVLLNLNSIAWTVCLWFIDQPQKATSSCSINNQD